MIESRVVKNGPHGRGNGETEYRTCASITHTQPRGGMRASAVLRHRMFSRWRKETVYSVASVCSFMENCKCFFSRRLNVLDVVSSSSMSLRASASSSSSSPTSSDTKRRKRTTVAELREQIKLLKAENEALKAALAAYEGRTSSSGDDLFSGNDEAGHPHGATTTQAVVDDALLEEEESEIREGDAITTKQSWKSIDDLLDALESGIKWPADGETSFWDRSPREHALSLEGEQLFEDDIATTHPESFQEPSLHLNSRGAPLHIIHITAEMAPIAKVGGLGDVVTGLSKASLKRGYNVEVILPYYECLEGKVDELQLHWEFDCPKGRSQDGVFHLEFLRTQAFTGKIDGCPVVLLRPDWSSTGSNLFRGSRIYGGSYNEAEAYLYFSRAALELITQSGRSPDIIHAHEWQCAAVPMLFWEFFSNKLSLTRPVLTIHNMDNQGECRQDEFCATGIPGEEFATVEKALDERTVGHNPERLCLLKGGIVYSSAVTTVSPTYAKETISGGASGWLRSTLARPDVINKYFGILNGIDTEAWNPATDPLLPACFNASVPHGKALCKSYLRRGLGMDDNTDKPLFAVISRLVPQKGIHLIEHAVNRVIEGGGQFVLLGTGHADSGLRRLAYDVYGTEHPDVRMIFGYSDTLAHQVYGAADIMLVPSMFEPCGLTQLIALRYGAVPLVRSTGGLADTVVDLEEGLSSDEQYNESYGDGAMHGAPLPNGFVFEGIDAESMDFALNRAIKMYFEDKDGWKSLVNRNLREGERWSWTLPSESYLSLYAGVIP